MLNIIFGVIGVLWGGMLVVTGLVNGIPVGGGSYGVGQTLGFLFGVFLLVVGGRALKNARGAYGDE